jgi:hypothetical protein
MNEERTEMSLRQMEHISDTDTRQRLTTSHGGTIKLFIDLI